MESVKDIIQQCHERRGKDLQQRETIVSPMLHGESPYHYIAYCARRYPLLLHDLEQADISLTRGDGFRRGAFRSIQERHLHAKGLTGTTSSSPTERFAMHLMPLLQCGGTRQRCYEPATHLAQEWRLAVFVPSAGLSSSKHNGRKAVCS